MKNKHFFPLLATFLIASFFSSFVVAQQFESTFGALANHEEAQDGKPIPSSRYIVLSNTNSFGPASRIMLTRLNSTGTISMNVTINEIGSPSTAYYGKSIDLDLDAAGTHTGYFIAGSRSTGTGRQAILLRTNTSGTVTWVKALPNFDSEGALDEQGVSVERQSNGDVIITASGFSAATNKHRFSVSKFTSAGAQLWSHRYYASIPNQNFEATEACNAVRSGVNVIVVTGRFRESGVDNTHTFLSCINASTGVEIWRRTYNAGQNSDEGLDVVYKPANGVSEPAALMAVGSSGLGHPGLWVIRANPLNGLASTKVYTPNVFYFGFSGKAVSLDVTGTKAAITGNIVYQSVPGTLLSGTYAMVMPFYGAELPDWTYYYSSSSPQFTEPHGIASITGLNAGYLVTCGSQLTGSAFNDTHTIRVNSTGSNGVTGCNVNPLTVTRTVTGTSSWRDFYKVAYTWTNIQPSRSVSSITQEFCTKPIILVSDARTEAFEEELVEPKLYPNPVAAGQSTTLAYPVAEAADVQIRVFDLTGREVWAYRERMEEGDHTMELPSGQWAKGAYFVQVQSGGSGKTLKLIVQGN